MAGNAIQLRKNTLLCGYAKSCSWDCENQQKIKSLSELVGAYKTIVSKKIHLLGYLAFKWQRSFHDYSIKDERSYYFISAYTKNNPSNWESDKFHFIHQG